jgi:ABC-type sugar transport system permease subunit
MFSTILAWAIFVISSIVLLLITYDGLRPRSEDELRMERLQAYVRGYRTSYSFWRILVIFVVWAASGVFLFG